MNQQVNSLIWGKKLTFKKDKKLRPYIPPKYGLPNKHKIEELVRQQKVTVLIDFLPKNFNSLRVQIMGKRWTQEGEITTTNIINLCETTTSSDQDIILCS